MASDIKILSVNCQGLNSYTKRRDVFTFLREKHFNIYCLQDTHFTKNIEKAVYAQWGYTAYFSSFASNARGTAILINNNFEHKVIRDQIDPNGNFILLDIIIESQRFSLLTLYGPNKDNPEFYEQLNTYLNDFGNEHTIICGDFNLVLNPDIDTENYRNVNNPRARNKVIELMEERNLCDAYRQLHENVSRFTWRKRTPRKQARLDFFLISDNLLPYLIKASIEHSYRSDHSSITLELKINEFKRGKGTWKFNNSLLTQIEYSNAVKETIRSVKEQYAIPVYNSENINTIPNKDIQFIISDQLFLDTLLMEIRGRTISYSSYTTKQKKLYENNLVKIINELEKNGDLEQLELKQTELQNHRKTALQGSIVRSRIKWIEEGEKPSKYFLSLENRNFTSKIIPKLIGENGSVISDQREILSETSKFYRQLYTEQSNTENVNLEDLFKNINTPKEEAEVFEGPVTYNELLQTLKEMKNNKSPGSDGYTAEFFKFFWNDIGHFVVKSINSGYDNGEMSITQKQGIIICLPKGDKPRQYLKNWRPITLLNIIYKLAAGAIASRFKKVLPKLIHTDQTGFIPGRCISENTRLIYDVLDYTEKHNIAGLLLLIDFEKAFDSVSWRFIHETLSYFKFGPSIKRWIQTFQNNISSSINQGGI